jgi:hypothetical protein
MNDDDLRDCFAMFAVAGMMARGDIPHKDIAYRAYNLADLALKARVQKETDESAGLPAIKRRVKKGE